jgi:uncharacterized membrane protein YbhN (UPF0104 family)
MSIPIPKQTIPADDRSQDFDNNRSPVRSPKEKFARWLKFGLRLGCTIILFVFLFRSISWSALLHNIPHLDHGALFIGVAIGLLGVIISAYQWQSLLDAEYIRMDLRRLVNFYLVGIAFNHFLPTGMGGDMVKAYYVGREGKNTVGAASAVIMSRATGFIGMLFISVPALFIWHALFPHDLTITFLLACFAVCGVLACAFCGMTVLPRFLTGKWAQNRGVALLLTLGNAIHRSVKQPHTTWVAVVFGMLFHFSAALNYYGYALVLHIQVPFVFYLVAVPFVSLIAFLPISINGFGLRETTFLYIFTTIHVLPTTSFLLAILMDLQTLLFGVIGGCIYLQMGMKKGKSRYGVQENE